MPPLTGQRVWMCGAFYKHAALTALKNRSDA